MVQFGLGKEIADTMPTYEYKCLDCGDLSEVFQSMKDEPLTTCEKCGGKLKRLIGTGAGFLFKGNGFYITDYRSESYKAAAKKDKPAAAADGGSSGNKTSGSDTTSGAKKTESTKK
jgi:putative FmdB family regulatory protein